ncbi:MAG: aminotransferase class V-fold PLP-dependent enzyme, partial [Gammaproteobacteria bacterium]|nr:aminotransferase class V-fold PLP-dependent enzyme [Gammaproteobacteria bacterium]
MPPSEKPAAFDVDYARTQFAGLENGWAFFDNAGGSLTLNRVIDRVSDYMRTMPVQLGASYAVSAQAAERQAQTVTSMAQFINAEPNEIVFGPSSTALLDRLARALRPSLRKNDEIIVTNIDHEANIGPWLRLRQYGIKIRIWEVNRDDYSLKIDDLKQLLNDKTRLVCFSQTTNIFGTIEPVKEITRAAHALGAKVCVDGVAYAPHRLVDVKDWDVDFYVFSLYKTFGPHIGMLYGKYEHLLELENLNHEYLGKQAVPYKFQPGGVCYELAWGAAGIPDYLSELGKRANGRMTGRDAIRVAFEAIALHESKLGK